MVTALQAEQSNRVRSDLFKMLTGRLLFAQKRSIVWGCRMTIYCFS